MVTLCLGFSSLLLHSAGLFLASLLGLLLDSLEHPPFFLCTSTSLLADFQLLLAKQRQKSRVIQFAWRSSVQRRSPRTPLSPAGVGFRPRCRRQRGRPTSGRVPSPLSFPAPENRDFARVGAPGVANLAFFRRRATRLIRLPTHVRTRACARELPSCFCTRPKLAKQSSRLHGCNRSTAAIDSAKSPSRTDLWPLRLLASC